MTEAALTDSDPRVTSAVGGVFDLLEGAIKANRPLEISPYRDELFEHFARAFADGLTGDDGPLGSDNLTRLVGRRWNLDESARAVTADQSKFAPEDVARMRAMWSLLRMWMEWDFAWHRWPGAGSPAKPR